MNAYHIFIRVLKKHQLKNQKKCCLLLTIKMFKTLVNQGNIRFP